MQTARNVIRIRTIVMLHAAALALTLSAATAAAQPKAVVVRAAKGVSAGALARADWYVARAEAFDVGEGRDGYFTLAKLYRTAGELRGADTAAVTNLRLAAWAYIAAGDSTAALRVMLRAAETADEVDQVERAVDTYMNAALIAYAGGRHREFSTSIRRADALLRSPRLSEESRAALLRRIDAEPVLAALASR